MGRSTENSGVGTPQEREASPQEQRTSLFERLIPILFVDDLQAERDFYVILGFTVTYQGAEFPDFIALGHGAIEFGISRREDFAPELPDRVLTWQFGVTDIEMTKQRLTAAGVAFREEWVTPREDWRYRVLHARTPNGYHLLLEGPGE
jgi:catechol 2,3-dioxygenase-like lactoylglutathione lyase family enzyme